MSNLPSSKIRIGVIGAGLWGPNQIRSFLFHAKATVVRVCDKEEARLFAVQNLFPTVETTVDFKQVTRAKDIDAVVITTPVSSHFKIAKDALLHGKDVLCEKPLTFTEKDSAELVRLAAKKKRILMVGHVFLFNPGIVKLKELMQLKEIGQTYYMHAQRTNLGPVRQDVNAVYDLASHDISIFNYLLNSSAPKVLSAVGSFYLQKRVEDVAFVSLQYPKNVLAHVHVSWLHPKKIRQITVVGQKKMLTWDDMGQAGPIEIYSKRVEKDYHYYKDFGEFHLRVKEGEIVLPSVKSAEPLKCQADHFIECVEKRKKPLTDGVFGLNVVRTLREIETVLNKSR